jgi:uncharacterized protein
VAKFARRTAIALLIAYLAVLAALFFAQRSMLFPAPQERTSPAEGFTAARLTTQDGLTLRAHWRAPDAGRSSVIYFHGNAGSLAGATAETEVLASKGYGVLLVEYRGYGGNPGEPSEQGFYRDGRAAMAFLAAQGVAPQQTIIAAHSMGTGTAVQMAQEFTPAALILLAPFMTLPDAAAAALPYIPVRWLMRDRFDNLGKVRGLAMPVLVLHGTADPVVPFALGQRLGEASPTATFRAVEGAGHEISFDPGLQTVQAEWLTAQGL